MHQFFLRRGFCAEAMVFKFVYFKIFNNETDMHSLFVNNLFELRVEQRKTCYYRIRSVSALLLPYITDSICFALFFFHTIWIVLHIHVPSVYINVHFYLSNFYVKLNSCICQVSINVINLLRLGFRFVKNLIFFFYFCSLFVLLIGFFLLFCLKSVILQTIYKSTKVYEYYP